MPRKRNLAIFAGVALLLGPLLLFKSACALVLRRPDNLSQHERMRQLPRGKAPVKDKVSIYWDEHSIPFIEAQNDGDLAFALGIVHAHLRIDTIELFRVLATARVSELIGPIPMLAKLDHGLAILDFQKAGKAAIKGMSPTSRRWMEQFTRGLNYYLQELDERPVTHRLLGIEPAHFTLQDIAAISRLVSSDLSWATYIKYLRTKEPRLFEEFVKKRITDDPTDKPFEAKAIEQGLAMLTRSGSNSVVISGARSKNRAGLIASDPHVGLMLPNFWLLAGFKSPSYHAVGLMIPGVPILGEGRNMGIAWGGTNMRGISSHLYDVTELPDSDLKTKSLKIRRRGWFDKTVELRSSSFGNLISDLDSVDERFKDRRIAMQWVGHEPSDEIGAFLKASRATTWHEFEKAFADYHVSAMNMLYADAKGDIGMVAAYGQPILKDPSKTLELIKQPGNPRIDIRSPADQPNPHNPPQGFLVSANNKPFEHPPAPIAFNYANNDRYRRLSTLVAKHPKLDVENLKTIQLDHQCVSSAKLHKLLLSKINKPELPKSLVPTFELFERWDGNYDKDSRSAVLHFALMHELWQRYLQTLDPAARKHWAGTDRWKTELLAWLDNQDAAKIQDWISQDLVVAKELHEKFPTWGQFTVMTPQVVFGFIPGVGKKFRRDYTVPIDGSSDTINKYGRKLSLDQVNVTYGASARHISDLSDPDANFFVLNGGQDGWIFNENIDDQIPLWRRGEYIQVPLKISAVRKTFRAHVTRLEP